MISDSESDADTYQTSPLKPSNSKAKGRNEWVVKNALKPPRPATYTAKSLYDQIYAGDIDTNPEYQRDVVWSETKQISLIDSMFRNFYMPPIIFAVIHNSDGSEKRICIDGKQRLTSIRNFMDGIIHHRDNETNERLWFKASGALKKKDRLLPERYVALFQNKQIICVEYEGLTGVEEREIFQRVQMGVALSTAEKMSSIASPPSTFIRQIMHKYIEDDKPLAANIEWDHSRGRDFQTLAQALYTIDHFDLHSKGKSSAFGTATAIDKWLREPSPLDQKFVAKIHSTFATLEELAKSPKLSRAFKKPSRVAPIELVMILLLVSVWKSKFSLTKLSDAIMSLRADARAQHIDIRANTKVAKTMMDFIKGLEADLRDDVDAPVTSPYPNAECLTQSHMQLDSTNKKRKLDNIERDGLSFQGSTGGNGGWVATTGLL